MDVVGLKMTKYPIAKFYAPLEIIEGGDFEIFMRSLYAGGRPNRDRSKIAKAFDRYDAIKRGDHDHRQDRITETH